MTRFSARNLVRGDSSKHGIGIFVGRITAASEDENAAQRPTQMTPKESLRTGEDEYRGSG
jgi:hypothetical protein